MFYFLNFIRKLLINFKYFVFFLLDIVFDEMFVICFRIFYYFGFLCSIGFFVFSIDNCFFCEEVCLLWKREYGLGVIDI